MHRRQMEEEQDDDDGVAEVSETSGDTPLADRLAAARVAAATPPKGGGKRANAEPTPHAGDGKKKKKKELSWGDRATPARDGPPSGAPPSSTSADDGAGMLPATHPDAREQRLNRRGARS